MDKQKAINFVFGLIVIFFLIWTVDIILPFFNPDYKPLLSFLEVISKFLNIVLEM